MTELLIGLIVQQTKDWQGYQSLFSLEVLHDPNHRLLSQRLGRFTLALVYLGSYGVFDISEY